MLSMLQSELEWPGPMSFLRHGMCVVFVSWLAALGYSSGDIDTAINRVDGVWVDYTPQELGLGRQLPTRAVLLQRLQGYGDAGRDPMVDAWRPHRMDRPGTPEVRSRAFIHDLRTSGPQESPECRASRPEVE